METIGRQIESSGITDIVAVSFESRTSKDGFTSKEYNYYSEIDLKVGDILQVPTKLGMAKAIVRKINIPASEFQEILGFMKIIKGNEGDKNAAN